MAENPKNRCDGTDNIFPLTVKFTERIGRTAYRQLLGFEGNDTGITAYLSGSSHKGKSIETRGFPAINVDEAFAECVAARSERRYADFGKLSKAAKNTPGRSTPTYGGIV